MEELMNFWQNYNGILKQAAIIFAGVLLLLLLAGILRQIKKLNKSLGNITEKIKAYFDVILREEEEYEEDVKPEAEPVQVHTGEQEKLKMSAEQEKKRLEDEKLFNAVLQEYFS
ncbi:hypothetical protein VSQ32_16315 [Lachnospiraceae bacterium KK002]